MLSEKDTLWYSKQKWLWTGGTAIYKPLAALWRRRVGSITERVIHPALVIPCNVPSCKTSRTAFASWKCTKHPIWPSCPHWGFCHASVLVNAWGSVVLQVFLREPVRCFAISWNSYSCFFWRGTHWKEWKEGVRGSGNWCPPLRLLGSSCFSLETVTCHCASRGWQLPAVLTVCDEHSCLTANIM